MERDNIYITIQEYNKICSHLLCAIKKRSVPPLAFWNCRLFMMIKFAWRLGLRLGELRNIRRKHISFFEEAVHLYIPEAKYRPEGHIMVFAQKDVPDICDLFNEMRRY